jgi:hypothetical protein
MVELHDTGQELFFHGRVGYDLDLPRLKIIGGRRTSYDVEELGEPRFVDRSSIELFYVIARLDQVLEFQVLHLPGDLTMPYINIIYYYIYMARITGI